MIRRLTILLTLALSSLSTWADDYWWLERSDEIRCDTVIDIPLTPGHEKMTIEMRSALPLLKGENRRRYSTGISWSLLDGRMVEVAVTPLPIADDIYFNNSPVEVEIAEIDPEGGRSIIETKQLTKNVGLSKKANSLKLQIDREKEVNISFGKSYLHKIFQLDESFSDALAASAFIRGKGRVDLLTYEWRDDRNITLASPWTPIGLKEYFKQTGSDGYEGFWKYFDQSTDPRFSVLGGKYTLGIVKRSDGCYDIIYVDGARIGSDKWLPGMIKGRLKPTIFDGHFDLEWWDAEMNLIDDEASATFTGDNLISVEIPLFQATLRFTKMPMGK